MNKKLIFLFLIVAVIVNLCLGLELAGAASGASGDKINFDEWGGSFQLPSSKWSPIGQFYNQKADKEIFSYRRESLTNKAGIDIQANISFIFEKVNYFDVNTYSNEVLTQVPLKITKKLTAADGLTLKKAVGYIGTSKEQDGTEHTIVLVHALSSGKGIQVIMDIPTELYPRVKGEFKMVLSSIQF